MPLEISEIGVHLAVGDAEPPVQQVEHGSGPNGGSGLTPAQHEAIVNACVQQVMRQLRQMQER